MIKEKLCVGTANWTQDYGSVPGKPQYQVDDLDELFNSMTALDVRMFDTAPAYGNAEELLGARLLEHQHTVTKTPHIAEETISAESLKTVETSLLSSLRLLRTDKVYALLVHNVHDLFKPNGSRLADIMQKLLRLGLVEHIGFSAYTVDEVERGLTAMDANIVQLPMNILDQRFLRCGLLAKLGRKGIEVHARSPFLQGVLLSDPRQLPAHFDPVKDKIASMQSLARELSIDIQRLAYEFVAQHQDVGKVVVGFRSAAEFSSLFTQGDKVELVAQSVLQDFYVDDESLILPTLWPR